MGPARFLVLALLIAVILLALVAVAPRCRDGGYIITDSIFLAGCIKKGG